MAATGMATGRRGLPVLGQSPAERADAARNRRALLAAAHEIMRTEGIDALSMDRVAAAAGVGIGTVYRRFGDRAGLAFALLDDEEAQFQHAFLSGPPPLGPGVPPAARIRAFLHVIVDRMDSAGELHALAESRTPTARHASGAYRTSRAHLVALLTQIDPYALDDPQRDPAFRADALLAIVTPGLILHQRRELGYSADRIKAGLDSILAALLGPEAVRGDA